MKPDVDSLELQSAAGLLIQYSTHYCIPYMNRSCIPDGSHPLNTDISTSGHAMGICSLAVVQMYASSTLKHAWVVQETHRRPCFNLTIILKKSSKSDHGFLQVVNNH